MGELPNRRRFLKRAIGLAAAGSIGTIGYGFVEPYWPEVTKTTVAIRHLPKPFIGKSIAVLADIHLGRYTGIDFVRHLVDATNAEKPDLIALVGDYVYDSQGVDLFAPCFDELKRLTAPLGVFCVPGNHDYWDKIQYYHAARENSGIIDVTNTGKWLEIDGARIRVCGVDDLWCGKPNIEQALNDCSPTDPAIVLCHNPDFVEYLTDKRAGLVVSGHTHGGQVRVPLMSPVVPSRFGAKYLHGLVQGPVAQVYVSRGLGLVGVPLRFHARPEIAMLTLAAA